MDGFERITGREHDGLVEKCQENGWLKVGGFDWQDDPFLEEYPYEFSRTDSVDRLDEGGRAVKDTVKVMPAQLKEAVDAGRSRYLVERAEHARQASRAAEHEAPRAQRSVER